MKLRLSPEERLDYVGCGVVSRYGIPEYSRKREQVPSKAAKASVSTIAVVW